MHDDANWPVHLLFYTTNSHLLVKMTLSEYFYLSKIIILQETQAAVSIFSTGPPSPWKIASCYKYWYRPPQEAMDPLGPLPLK